MEVTRYKVTCLDCGGESIVEIDGLDRVYWSDVHQVISGRKRLDAQWGWQCKCGANDIMSKQEARMIADSTNPKPSEIEEIVNNLEIEQPKFNMRNV